MKNRFVLSIFVPTALVASLVVMPWGRRAHAADSAAGDCLAASAASLRLDSQHRVRAERAELLKCAAPACPADIKKECIRRVDDVTAAIPSIMFDVKDGEGNDLSAITVTMDAEILTDRLEGIALAVDPGAHLFTFEAAGHAPVRKQFVIREGEKRRLEVITFGPRGAAGPASGAHDAVSVEAGAAGRSPSGSGASLSSAASSPGAANGTLSGSASHSSNVAPLLAAGVGVAGLAVGSVFGLRALSKRNDARKSCPDLCTDENGVSQWNDAKRAGTVSTVAFAIGGAGVAGALILWLTARPESSEVAAGRQPQVTVGLGNIGMRGQW